MGVIFSEYYQQAILAALHAGQEIMDVYRAYFDVEYKSDNSPITLADKRAHESIVRNLSSTGLPILSEEGADIPIEERVSWHRYWLIDPLDGTREFVKRNGEFCVNIALMENNIPVFGVVYAPVLQTLYAGGKEHGVFKSDKVSGPNDPLVWQQIQPQHQRKSFVVVGSRSHAPISEEIQQRLEANFHLVEVLHLGSSLKICLIAEGTADLYLREGPTMEWDTAAGDAFCRAFDQPILNLRTHTPLEYNKVDLRNPDFYAGKLA